MAHDSRRHTIDEYYHDRPRKQSDGETTKRRKTTTPLFGKNLITTNHASDISPRRESRPRKRQSLRTDQRAPTFQDQLQIYKTQLIDDLNTRISSADDEINQGMDDMAQRFDENLQIIEGAGRNFHTAIADETVEIDEGLGGMEKKQLVLGQVMTDLEELIGEKTRRLDELTAAYDRVHRRTVELAIVILGEEKVCIDGFQGAQTRSTTAPRGDNKDSSRSVMDVNVTIDVVTIKSRNAEFEQLYENAEARLGDLQDALDDLVVRNLEENKKALKAFQAGRKSKQGELSKLLTSWTLS